MESTCVDTSLNLNLGPSRRTDVAPEALVQELHRLNGENKRLTEKLTHLFENYNLMQKQLSQLMSMNANNPEKDPSHQSKKRKAETENCIDTMFSISGNTECSTITHDEEIFKRSTAKVSKVLVRTQASDSDTSLYVRDGYQWRKYGQKVTRDNPSPRAYFKCSFAPSCPVKKRVQRSLVDPTVLVATYEGEHNHVHNGCELPVASTQSEAGALDSAGKSLMQRCLIQQMASSLTRDPNFKAALATAISGRLLDLTSN